jgi:hypothetical protein
MAKIYEARPISDHIVVRGYAHGALGKDDLVQIGGITGLVDHSCPVNADISVDIGVARAIFQINAVDITGDAAVGGTLYIGQAGELTMTAEVEISDDVLKNTAFGVVIEIGDTVVYVVKL